MKIEVGTLLTDLYAHSFIHRSLKSLFNTAPNFFLDFIFIHTGYLQLDILLEVFSTESGSVVHAEPNKENLATFT